MFFNFAPILHTVPPEHNAGNKAPLWFLWCVNIFFFFFYCKVEMKRGFRGAVSQKFVNNGRDWFLCFLELRVFYFLPVLWLDTFDGILFAKAVYINEALWQKKVFVWIRENLVIVPLIYIPLLGRALLLEWEVLGHSYQATDKPAFGKITLLYDFIKQTLNKRMFYLVNEIITKSIHSPKKYLVK